VAFGCLCLLQRFYYDDYPSSAAALAVAVVAAVVVVFLLLWLWLWLWLWLLVVVVGVIMSEASFMDKALQKRNIFYTQNYAIETFSTCSAGGYI
jgi:hypothetical protein